jgi:hypothetical protein
MEPPQHQRTYGLFYQRFEYERTAFMSNLSAISSDTDREHYANLVFTRLLLLYFLQRHNLLHNNPSYLSDHLRAFQHQTGNFYQDFLMPLFHTALSGQEQSSSELALFGILPRLLSKIFHEQHNEQAYSSIQIPNAFFTQLFLFFDSYQWHIDENCQQGKQAIAPSIFGFLFERRQNRSQAGTYNTGEDIAAYIARNTIISQLLKAVQRLFPTIFQPGGLACKLLQNDPLRYIYPATKKGCHIPLPAKIAGDAATYGKWNQQADQIFALPSETWREVVARRKQLNHLCEQLHSAPIQDIHTLVISNVDITCLLLDIIHQCQDILLLNGLLQQLKSLSILDPTCGTGAFLLSALDLLLPIYEACHIRLYELQSPTPNPTYMRKARSDIISAILSNNLYGVDIQEEAIEICRLRLLLKLLAHIEPGEPVSLLPDLSHNIRSGNILLGAITTNDTDQTSATNQRPPNNDGYSPSNRNLFKAIVQNGAFDVVIGNPPYIEYERVQHNYQLTGYRTLSTGNLCAFTLERSLALLKESGHCGMIMPASVTCTDGYLPLQALLLEQSWLTISSYSDQRGKLFTIPHPRLNIILCEKGDHCHRVFSTPYMKLQRKQRPFIFQRLTYLEVTSHLRPGIIPRYGDTLELEIHNKLYAEEHELGHYLSEKGQYPLYFTRKLSWYVQVTPFTPLILDRQGTQRLPSELKTLRFSDEEYAYIAFAALNSNLFYWFLTTGSDCRNLNMREVRGFPLHLDRFSTINLQQIVSLAHALEDDLQAHSEQRVMHFKNAGLLTLQCLFPARSRSLIDEIDRVLAQHYGFSSEELDFLLQYDGKFREHPLERRVKKSGWV